MPLRSFVAAIVCALLVAGPARAEERKPADARKADPASPVKTPADRPTLLVFDLVAEKGVERSAANLLTEIVIDKVAKTGRYTVVGQKDLDKMVFWEQNKQLQGCTDTSCLVQIAGAMGAAYYVEGSAGVVGSQYIITLKMIDAQKVAVLSRSTMRVKKDDDVMVDTIIRMVGELLAAIPVEQKKEPAAAGPVQAPFKEAAAPGAQKAEAVRPSDPYRTPGQAEPEKRSHFWRWMSLGGGVGFLVIGAACTGAAAQTNADYEAHKVTRAEAETTVKRDNGLAIGAYVLGAGLIGTGIWLWVKESREESAAATPAPATVSIDVAPVPNGAVARLGGRW